MKPKWVIGGVIVWAWLAAWSAPAQAQVVQLPSIETFSYSGSVLVPDRGTASLGGVGRSSQFRNRSQGNVSRGSSTSHSGLSVSATIIDLDAMDRQLRGLDRPGHGWRTSVSRDRAQRGGAGAGAASSPGRQAPAAPVVTTSRANQDRVASAKVEKAKATVRLARRYLSVGDSTRSKIAYQSAIANLDGELKEYAIAEYRSIFLPR